MTLDDHLWHMARGYRRLRAMRWRDALRYMASGLTGRTTAARFPVLGFDVFLRPGTTDLTVACESLGAELEPAISYLPGDFAGVIVDAGGYIGTSALKLARAFPAARIIVLEPDAANHALLERNTAGVGNIVTVRAALSDSTGTSRLQDRRTGHWGFTIVERPADSGGVLEGTEIRTISIRDLMAEHGIDEIGLFKIDIEGAEARLLAAAGDWLDHTDLLIIELHEFIVPGVEALFRKATAGRVTLRLPGEKHVSIRRGPRAGAA